MKDNAIKGSKAAATANEQSTDNQVTNKDTNMDNRKSTQYHIPESTVLADMSAKGMLDFIATEIERSGFGTVAICYAIYWGLLKELRKKAFSIVGVANFQRAKHRKDEAYVNTTIQQYESVAEHLQALYERYDQHVGFLNAILNDIHQKRPARRLTRNNQMVTTEEYRPLALEPFTRRLVMDATPAEDDGNAWDEMDADEQEQFGYEAEERELAMFMQQHDLKTHKNNLSQSINGWSTEVDGKQQMESDEQVIYEPINKEEWLSDMHERSEAEIIEDAKMGGWAMLRALARRFVPNSWVQELIKDSALEDVDWDTATGGKALSLAIKLNSRRISSLNFIDSLKERIDYELERRQQQEARDSGTVGESSLPVSGAKHDDLITEYQVMIKDSEKEIAVYAPMAAQLYEAARLFGTTDDRPIPDYRTAFQKDPADYSEMLTADMTIEQIEVDVVRKGKTLKRPLWLVMAFGDDDHCRKVAEECRKVRYEMTKHEQVLSIRAMGDADRVSTDTLDASELVAAIDSLLD